jgi:hypothetical protein
LQKNNGIDIKGNVMEENFTFESYFVDTHSATYSSSSSSSSDSEFECEEGATIPKKSFEDFQILTALGEGAYGKVEENGSTILTI